MGCFARRTRLGLLSAFFLPGDCRIRASGAPQNTTTVTSAHSLERPEAITDHEAPIYFRLDFFL